MARSVRLRYGVGTRAGHEGGHGFFHTTVLEFAEAHEIGFIPWFPLATGQLAEPGGPLDEIARDRHATPS